MTVSPGWGGQPFIAHSLEKIPRVRAIMPPGVALEVDGGIDAATAPDCLAAGANLFVAGSAIFGAADPAPPIRRSPPRLTPSERAPHTTAGAPGARRTGGRQRALSARQCARPRPAAVEHREAATSSSVAPA